MSPTHRDFANLRIDSGDLVSALVLFLARHKPGTRVERAADPPKRGASQIEESA